MYVSDRGGRRGDDAPIVEAGWGGGRGVVVFIVCNVEGALGCLLRRGLRGIVPNNNVSMICRNE